MIEFGGCLPFQLDDTGEYFTQYADHLVRLNSMRSSLSYVIQTFGYKTIYLPIYNCPTVYERVFQSNSDIQIKFYNIDQNFMPLNLTPGSNEVVLWVNYFGCMYPNIIKHIIHLYAPDLIIDNCQAFFQAPELDVFNIYSCRKFFSVPDGSYVIGRAIKPEIIPPQHSYEHFDYLLKACEEDSNSSYKEYLQNEKNLTYSMSGMSKSSLIVLKAMPYEKFQQIRYRNFCILHQRLGKKNKLDVYYDTMTSLVYPFLYPKDNLRELLINEKVYISTWWKHILTKDEGTIFEKNLSKFLLPLPIDQRYSETDMEQLANIVLKFI